ncbi:MAG: MerR family DNA-binding protein [Steroidobacteraceae bacterium]
MSTLSIGQLAKSAQVGISTIHYYEKQGLIPKVVRRASGYRQYEQDDVRRLQFICRAKRLGFSLEEIGELLTLQTQSTCGVEKAKAIAQKKLIDVEAKIAELQRLRATLADLVTACPGHGETDHCPILQAFDNDLGVTA